VIMSRDEGLDDVVDYQDLEVLAVIMPNDPGIRNVDWHTYETTVDAVEALSGYDLLALLPNAVEVAVENGTKEALDLIDQFVTDGKLSSGNAKALKAKLDAATGQLVKGHTTPALAQLQSVLNQLDEVVSSGELSATDADALRVLVEGVIDTVSP